MKLLMECDSMTQIDVQIKNWRPILIDFIIKKLKWRLQRSLGTVYDKNK